MAWIPLGLGAAALGVGVATVSSRCNFHRRTEAIRHIVESGAADGEPRRDLPPPVAALAERLGAAQRHPPAAVRLTQTGAMWRTPGAAPLPFSACQSLTVGRPGFLWDARFPLGGPLAIDVVDYLAGEEGGLEVRLGGALPMVSLIGTDDAFRGEAMRYLGELVWNPDAILFNRHLDWRILDGGIIAVSLGAAARRSEVRLVLDAAGDPVRLEADDRPRAEGRTFRNCPWFGRCGDFRTAEGRRIPSSAEVGWVDDGREIIYWRGHIETWIPIS